MNFQSMSNPDILAELGRRLRQRRLNANLTQDALASHAGVSLNTVRNAEGGSNSSVDTLVSLLRSLNALGDLQQVLLDEGPSPVELAQRDGRTRQRASTAAATPADEGEWQW
ncbi:MAG: helix-turn-helix domain-containing protein [Woeseia sp.]